jgi:hypothetical protein
VFGAGPPREPSIEPGWECTEQRCAKAWRIPLVPVVTEAEHKRRFSWKAALLAAPLVLLALGGAGAYLSVTAEPIVLGGWALTGPRCWVEEPAPNFVRSGPPGTVEFFEVRIQRGGYGLYQREPASAPTTPASSVPQSGSGAAR